MSKNLQIKKSNALVEAGYRLTLGEHRVILACIAKSQTQTLDDQTLYALAASVTASVSSDIRYPLGILIDLMSLKAMISFDHHDFLPE